MATGVRPYNGVIRSVRVVHRARVVETLFRSGKGGREPLAPPGEGGNHVHYQSSRQNGIGSVTSRPAGASTPEELLAFIHGLTVAEVRQMLAEGRDGH